MINIFNSGGNYNAPDKKKEDTEKDSRTKSTEDDIKTSIYSSKTSESKDSSFDEKGNHLNEFNISGSSEKPFIHDKVRRSLTEKIGNGKTKGIDKTIEKFENDYY